MDKRETLKLAQQAMRSGRYDAAVPHLWSLLDRAHVTDEEFGSHLRLLAQAFVQLDRKRAAGAIHLFVGELDAAWRLAEGEGRDRARCLVASKRHLDAARLFEEAGWIGQAAIQLEDGGDQRGARVLWERLAGDRRLGDDLYTQGLVRFNLGQACARLGDADAGRRATVEAIHLLEAAADGFETLGLRERAFDCFQVLLTMGRAGSFENLAEGYVNCIRILSEDNLRYYVLQYFEDFQRMALERGELHAAATLFREAAEFSRRQNLPYDRHYRWEAAKAHAAAAEKTLRSGASVELAENAYAAAIDAYNEVGAYSKISEIYAALAGLPLAEKRTRRYARLMLRLASVRDVPGETTAFPDYLRMETAYPEIWRLDVVEWELDGDPAATMGEVLQDPKNADFTRRRALLCRLHQLASSDGALGVEALVGLASHLGRVEIYASLAPLERMFGHDDARVRAAVLAAVQRLFFKRSFVLVRRGLADEEEMVRREALEAVSTLHFGHAFDPLAHIYRASGDAAVRRAALESIGRIRNVDAAEMLLDVLRHGPPEEQGIARKLLAAADHPGVAEMLERALAFETGEVRSLVESVIRSRGGR